MPAFAYRSRPKALSGSDHELLLAGVGRGLAVASRLTGLLGGKLSYQRFVGKTYFIVSLPGLEQVAGDESDRHESVADVIRAMSA